MGKSISEERQVDVSEGPLHDLEPSLEQFRDDVVQGLSRTPKVIPSKYLYDERGSQLFDAICELPEYYPTRTEFGIMREHGAEMAALLGPGCLLIEYGSGSSTKTRVLLDHMTNPAGYVPIDISRDHLLHSTERLRETYPSLEIQPVCVDYTQPFDLPDIPRPVRRRVVYYPGSTIGNFHPHEAREFLRGIAAIAGKGGGLILGVDLQKPPDILEPAYNDSAGVTAAFNLNLLERINRELGADFEIDRFEHRAPYNAEHSRIEMHLISNEAQSVRIGETEFSFEAGESLITEYSYKFTLDGFAELAASAGFQVERVWTDDQNLFSVQYLTVTDR